MIAKLLNVKFILVTIFMATANIVHASGNTNECVIAGSKDAAITIQEFADFECGYCAEGANTMKEILKNYPERVNLVFRNLPLPFHQNALIAAKAFSAVCLQSSSLAYSYQSELFDNQEKLANQGESYLYQLAEKVGVNVPKMKTDMNGEVVAKIISEDQQLAKAHNFRGTPSFLIGSEPVVGALPYEEIKKVIDKQLDDK